MLFLCRRDDCITIALTAENKDLLQYRDVTIISCLNASDEFFSNLLEIIFIGDEDNIENVYLLDYKNFAIYTIKDKVVNNFSTFIFNGIATFYICDDKKKLLLKLYKLGVLSKLWQKVAKKMILKQKKL